MSAPAAPSLATSRLVGVASGLRAAPSDPARVLPVRDELADLFPWGGLRRGTTIAVRGSTALLLALLAEATANGSWAAVVGVPDLGVLAAAETGVVTDRLALIPDPGAQPSSVIAALLDGLDLVAVAPGRLADAHARRLSARARHRGAVLLPLGPWPGVDLELRCDRSTWTGLGLGHGHLRQREVVVHTRGRGSAARPGRATLLLPGPTGTVRPAPFEPPTELRPRLRDRAG
ncbi:MAG TPA: hypothetical protein VGX25_11020 [Actinophytocola sp.]|uniref:hypothetical protein n=1 Tax=Actinophytocola sp. TaxID=1872138 RepID=UPI002DDD836A|nr:hypothetical protein [Actinophytocola sp.]HEV2779917.1 hypothetical protein [Actinophytocola sp.]